MNPFIVLVLDALLHLASIVVLGSAVVVYCKLLTKGFVDAKLFTGLTIATLLVITRVFLLNNIGRVLSGSSGEVLLIASVLSLFLVGFFLVYKLVSIPAIGTFLSTAAIVATQLALAHYTPILSLKLMPEGQRFAEYAGLANSRTEQLMAQAKSLKGRSGGFREMLSNAAKGLAFFTSEDEQKNLSKDFASGIALYKERKAYMDSMSEEELADYRAAMGAFLQEQGLEENRYSLSNLKNAQPEDLENLASFMKDMSSQYGLAEDIPATDGDGEEAPPTAESLMSIAANLSKINLSSEDSERLKSILTQLDVNAEKFSEGFENARREMSELTENSEELIAKLNQFKVRKPGESNDVIESGGYRIKKLPPKTNDASGADFADTLSTASNQLVETTPPPDPTANYFKPEELSPFATSQCIVLIPKDANIHDKWVALANSIQIDAWFAGVGPEGKSTIIIEGNGLQSGSIWEVKRGNNTYSFRFEGIEAEQITLTALEETITVP